MSEIALKNPRPLGSGPAGLSEPRRSRLRRISRLFARIVFSPLRLFLSVRRSMTAASVTLLLIGIITLNIIWGYPWSGLFSACMSLLFVGWIINRIMRPNLEINFSLPNSTAAGEPFSVVTHVQNRGRFPAMDLGVAFRAAKTVRRKNRPASAANCQTLSPPQSLSLIRPADRTDLHASLLFERRGVHRMPDVIVTSMFPFHLFRSSRRYKNDARIAVTPRLITGDEDSLSRALLNTLGGWSRKLLSGDALDYTGSREYVVGMPVRRWDFASWARLGQPIVREFQSPSIQMVTLIVDTSNCETGANRNAEQQPWLERVLSVAATAVVDLSRKTVRVRLYVTSEPTASFNVAGTPQSIPDSESLLIRLAAAESVPVDDANIRAAEIVDLVGRFPVLILTARLDFQDHHSMPPNVTVIRVDPPHRNVPPNSPSILKHRWRKRKHRSADASRSDAAQGA